MKRITGIKKDHHFRLSSSSPGTIFVKERSDSVEVEVDLLKDPWNPDVDELPPVVPPRGLNADRQWYLYEQIRPFCPLEDQDSVCLLPSVPKPGGSRGGTSNPDSTVPPPAKRRRVCAICKEEVHDRRTCPDK